MSDLIWPERRAKLAALRGLVSEETGLRLAELAAAVPADRAIVEIGSFCGKSTCYLAEGSRLGHGAIVTAVDPWDLPGNVYGKHGFTDVEVRETFARQVTAMALDAIVRPVRGFSTGAAATWPGRHYLRLDGSPVGAIGLLFIDGDHTFDAVRDDFFAWAPYLETGSVVAFDDYGTKPNPGVRRFVDELAGDAGVRPRCVVPTLAELEIVSRT